MTSEGHRHSSGDEVSGLGPGQANWDERYREKEQIWSGRPNEALVAEVGDQPPGRALDVGCGEGADAVWLARRGWRVTALDVSAVALERAKQGATEAGVEIEWVHAGLLDGALGGRRFDLVNVQYPALLRTRGRDAERALIDAVAPGGTLLVVHHANIDVEHAKEHGFDPADYVTPGDVAELLDDSWTVLVHETRPREVPAGHEGQYTEDLILHARRQA